MTKLTWKGEDDFDGPGIPGPSFMVWKGHKFPVGKPVEIGDDDMIRRAKGNRYFLVDEDEPPSKRGPGRPPKVKTDGDENQG